MDRERRNEILARLYDRPEGQPVDVYVDWCPAFPGAPSDALVIAQPEMLALCDAGLISGFSKTTRGVIPSDHGRQYWRGIKRKC